MFKKTPVSTTTSSQHRGGVDPYQYDEEDDDDEPLFLRVETAIIAPPHMIGTIPWLQVGVVIAAKNQPHSIFFHESRLLITYIGTDVYRGLVLNKPLPPKEIETLRLRISSEQEFLNQDTRRRITGFWIGGPVKDPHEEWHILHTCANVNGATQVGARLWLGATDPRVLLGETCGGPIHVFYKFAQWLPGQLEKELAAGFWIMAKAQTNGMEDLREA